MLLSRRFSVLNGTALLVGGVVGLAAVFFRYAINLVEDVAFRWDWSGLPRFSETAQETNEFLRSDWGLLVFLVPAAGGLIVGIIRHYWPESRNQGVTEVMASVQVKGGILRGRSSWGHAIISAITVGTGGSTGREGTIGYIGAAIGSSFSRRLGFRPRDVRVLLGCGFAAGIAATFNTPLGGVLLALELVLPEFSTHAFIPVVAATVVGVTVAHFFLRDDPTFDVPLGFELESPWELGIYLVLGILCGLGAVLFIRTMQRMQEAWAVLPAPEWTKPMLGGLVVGFMGVMAFAFFGEFHIFGTGYATVSDVLSPDGATVFLPLLLTLIVLKPLATTITIGSGGGGGVFSASLYQGALYGGVIGLLANLVFENTAPPYAYALVGMGAFYAAAARATLTAIVMLSELINDYSIILPLMFAAVTADAVSVGLSRDSIYTVRLAEKGILYDHDRVQSPLDFLQVKDVMRTKVDTLPTDLTVGDAFNRMLDLGHTGYPVVEGDGRLFGIVTRRDLSRHLQEGRGQATLKEVVPGRCITAVPAEMLHRARDRIFQEDIGRLVVVDPEDRKRILGILTRSDLLRAEAERDVEHDDSWTGARIRPRRGD